MLKTPMRYLVLIWAGVTCASANDVALLCDVLAKLAEALPSQGSVLAARCVYLSYGDETEMALMKNALSEDLQKELIAVPMSSSHNFSDKKDLLNRGIDLVIEALLKSKDQKFVSRYQQLSPDNKARMRQEWLTSPVRGAHTVVTARGFTLALLLKIGESPAFVEAVQPQVSLGVGERIGAKWQSFKDMCARHNFLGKKETSLGENAASHDTPQQTPNTLKALDILNCRLSAFYDIEQEMKALSDKIGNERLKELALFDVNIDTHDFKNNDNILNQAIDTIIQYFAPYAIGRPLVVSPMQRFEWMNLKVHGEDARQFTLRVIGS